MQRKLNRAKRIANLFELIIEFSVFGAMIFVSEII